MPPTHKASHPFLGSKHRAQQLKQLSPAKHDTGFYIPPVAPTKLTKFSKSMDALTQQQQQQQHEPPHPKKKKPPRAINPRGQFESAELWLNQKLNSSFEDISVKLAPLNRTKEFVNVGVADRPQMTPLEVDIMRKIVVRENLLVELKRLIDNQTDVGNVILEVVELVKAIRFQTLDVVEDISSWIHAQPNKRPFLYRGANYLVKLCNDLDFMDSHDEIIERFCFELKMNPLAYRGGGNIIVGFGLSVATSSSGHGADASYAVGSNSSKSKLQTILNMRHNVGTYQEGISEGVEIGRLQRAERLIQQEFERRRGIGPAPPTYPQVGARDMLDLGLQPSVLTSKPSAISYLDASAGDAPLVLPGTPLTRDTGLASLDSQGPRSVRFHVGPHTLTDALASVDSDSAALFGSAASGGAEGFDAGWGSKARGCAAAAADSGKKMRPVVVSTRRKKQERTAQLEHEAEELRAREDKLSERVSDLVADYKEAEDKGAALEAQRKLALKKGREATAQKLVVEVRVLVVGVCACGAEVAH